MSAFGTPIISEMIWAGRGRANWAMTSKGLSSSAVESSWSTSTVVALAPGGNRLGRESLGKGPPETSMVVSVAEQHPFVGSGLERGVAGDAGHDARRRVGSGEVHQHPNGRESNGGRRRSA